MVASIGGVAVSCSMKRFLVDQGLVCVRTGCHPLLDRHWATGDGARPDLPSCVFGVADDAPDSLGGPSSGLCRWRVLMRVGVKSCRNGSEAEAVIRAPAEDRSDDCCGLPVRYENCAEPCVSNRVSDTKAQGAISVRRSAHLVAGPDEFDHRPTGSKSGVGVVRGEHHSLEAVVARFAQLLLRQPRTLASPRPR